MAEEGTLSILRRGTTYQVRYASNNPYDREPQPSPCSDERTVVTLLQQCGLAPWSITQAHMQVCFSGLSETPDAL